MRIFMQVRRYLSCDRPGEAGRHILRYQAVTPNKFCSHGDQIYIQKEVGSEMVVGGGDLRPAL